MVIGRTGKGLGIKAEEMAGRGDIKRHYMYVRNSQTRKNILGSLGREFKMSNMYLQWCE